MAKTHEREHTSTARRGGVLQTVLTCAFERPRQELGVSVCSGPLRAAAALALEAPTHSAAYTVGRPVF